MPLASESVRLSPTVSYLQQADIAVLWLDNPPVNGLGDTTRAGIHAGLKRAIEDESVVGIVVAGSGKVFCGGADIRQFNTPAATAWPLSRDVQQLIESSRKPVVAAIHGVALGGGLELALGCHYRVVAHERGLGCRRSTSGLSPAGAARNGCHASLGRSGRWI